MPRVLVRKEATISRARVGEEALIGELAHAGVHDRIARAALLPGVEPPPGALPATSRFR
jgi:hypothetical protein